MAKNSPKRTTRRKKTKKGPISTGLTLFDSLRSGRLNPDQSRKVFAWTLIFVSLISIIACVSYFFSGNADQSELEAGVESAAQVNNWLGYAGAKIAEYVILRGFGIFGFIPLLFVLGYGLALLEHEAEYYGVMNRLLKHALFITLFGSIFFAFIEILTHSTTFDLGGGFGYATVKWLSSYVGYVGVGFLVLFAVVMFWVLNFNAEVKTSRLIESLKNTRIPKAGEAIKQAKETAAKARPKTSKQTKANKPITPQPKAEEPQPSSPSASTSAPSQPLPPTPPIMPADQPQVGQEISFEVKSPPTRGNKKKAPANQEVEFTINQQQGDESMPVKQYEQIGEDNIGRVIGEGKVEKIVPEADQELENPDELFDPEEFDPRLELRDFKIPPFELLEDHGAGRDRGISEQELLRNKNKIEETLRNYGIGITKISATVGPTVTLYEIIPAPGVRISKIKNLEDDIALSLAALGIRIIAPIPGKGTIGIEVPNSKQEVVSLRGVMSTEKFITTKAHLPIAIGRTIANEVFIGDLNKMPHLLIAGATGQGKSVGLNTIIASLLYKKHPAEVKFVLIDPKKVEMSLYQSLKQHYIAQLPDQEEPIITDVRDAVNVLKSLCIEMDNRYDLLKKARVRNLQEYNKKFTGRKLSPRKGHQFMPYIVLVIDELADMMMIAGKEVEMPIARLAQLARAVGIHLVVATQRPSVNVITGIIKANFPARMSYRVISKVDSRTILDANGADQLIGRGDLLLSTGSELIRIQNAFIDTPEVERLVDHIADQRGFPSPYYLPELPMEDGDIGDEDEPFEKDSRFEEAARLIVKYQIGSASLIQRKMKLGYNRAGRIIDQLEKAKIVGPHSGSKPRDVLVTSDAELERYLSEL